MRKAIVLAGSLVLSLLGFGTGIAPYGSVVGHWKFNDPNGYGADSSGFGHTLTTFQSGVAGVQGTGAKSNGYDGSGYLNISTAGNKVMGSFDSNWLDASKGYTILIRYKNTGFKATVAGDPEVKKLLNTLNDKNSWHFAAYRYDPDLRVNKQYAETLYTDPTYGDRYGTGYAKATDGSYAEAVGSKGTYLFPVAVTSSGITIGGKIGANRSGYNVNFIGYIDEVVIVSRVLCLQELTRAYQTGENFVYSVGTTETALSFSSSGGDVGWSYRQWAADGHEQSYAPSAIPGADFIVDNYRTVTADLTEFPCRSLTLGRVNPLMGFDNHKIARGQETWEGAGNVAQSVSTLSIADLRVPYGRLSGTNGQTLNVSKLTLEADEATYEYPFSISIDEGESTIPYRITGRAVGGGWLWKWGRGVIDLSDLSGDYKVKVQSGSIKCSKIDAYGGGTVVVPVDGPVTVASTYNGVGKVTVKFNRVLNASGEFPILVIQNPSFAVSETTGWEQTADSSVSVSSAALRYEGVKVTTVGATKTVSLVCQENRPPEDLGQKPMLLWK